MWKSPDVGARDISTPTIGCSVCSNPPAILTWRFNGGYLPGALLVSPNNEKIIVERGNKRHIGNYTCTATNLIDNRTYTRSFVIEFTGTDLHSNSTFQENVISNIHATISKTGLDVTWTYNPLPDTSEPSQVTIFIRYSNTSQTTTSHVYPQGGRGFPAEDGHATVTGRFEASGHYDLLVYEGTVKRTVVSVEDISVDHTNTHGSFLMCVFGKF